SGEGRRLVRQRVGLLVPLRRPGRFHRQEGPVNGRKAPTMNKKTVEDIDVQGKRVLVRVDFNVPQDETGRITDENRIVAALPTIRYLMEHGAKTVLVSHLGRPKGVTPKYTLAPVAAR